MDSILRIPGHADAMHSCCFLILLSQLCDVEGDIQGTVYTISAPNHCLLLCDLHIGMTIDGRLDADGVYEWVDQDGEAITAAEGDNPVECWAGRIL